MFVSAKFLKRMCLLLFKELCDKYKNIVILAENEKVGRANVFAAEKDFMDADAVLTQFETTVEAVFATKELAKKYGKKVIAFSGCVTNDAEICNEHGIDAFFPILRSVSSLEQALNTNNAYNNLSATAYQVFRLLGV